MTTKQIDDLAKHKLALPSCTLTEAGLYYRLCQLYDLYDKKAFTVDEAKQEKARLIEAFEHDAAKDSELAELQRRIEQHIEIFRRDDEQRVKLSGLMCEANKNGCEICKKIAEVYDNRE